MIHTTLNKIRAHDPCAEGWRKLLAGIGKTESDDEPLPLVKILEINGLDDALWALRTVDCDREARLFAVGCARQVQHLMTDPRSIAALDVAERFANRHATRDDLAAARDAAREAVRAAAWDAARAAAAEATWDAAWEAAEAARDAAWEAAEAARAAAWEAAEAAAAARAAAWDARDAAREKQAELFREIFG